MVIASIDLMQSKVVQLKQGKEKMIERDDPFSLAKEFDKYGEVAVIDLDRAMEKSDNYNIVKEIIKIAECRVGGGIKSIEKAKELISLGAKKIIIGSKAFENDKINHAFLNELKSAIGKSRIIIAIDAYESEIVTCGWKHKTGLNIFKIISSLEPYSSGFLYTCVEKEGLLQGINIDYVRQLTKLTKNKLTVAGGVKSLDEIKELSSLNVDVQLGMALYTNKINLRDAFIESLSWKNDLIPTITQDTQSQILMLAYSNKESLAKTFETSKIWYFSRSRNKLWMKGEVSGNTQEFIKIRSDCDKDSILITGKQKAVACHTGDYSCFGDKKFSLQELYEIVSDRIMNPTANSYTSKLNDKLLAQKILEEAAELVSAKQKDEKIWEAADCLYFITVFLAKNGITFSDVLTELKRRRNENN
jgi:phosphoribosyl-ATP pyrophosphohydrolase/phosphoribosyl-AMP cyclohydrolase